MPLPPLGGRVLDRPPERDIADRSTVALLLLGRRDQQGKIVTPMRLAQRFDINPVTAPGLLALGAGRRACATAFSR